MGVTFIGSDRDGSPGTTVTPPGSMGGAAGAGVAAGGAVGAGSGVAVGSGVGVAVGAGVTVAGGEVGIWGGLTGSPHPTARTRTPTRIGIAMMRVLISISLSPEELSVYTSITLRMGERFRGYLPRAARIAGAVVWAGRHSCTAGMDGGKR
jgi:hypothetical protein